MDEYPRMLYLAPGPQEIHGGHFATLIVGSEDEQADALARGWSMGTAEAKAARAELDARAAAAMVAPDQAPTETKPAEDTPPSRAELEQKAGELGLKFDGRTGDKKLRELIAEKLGA